MDLRAGGERPLIEPTSVALLVAVVLMGTLVGTITGILPGLHVNTVAPVVLGATTLIPAAPGLPAGTLAALLILAVAVVHTILNVIPTLAAPIPDGDESLVLLPIQRMAKGGHAVDALRISIRGSWLGGAIATTFAVLVLFAWPLGAPKVPPRLALWAVTGIIVMLILGHSRPGRSVALLFLAGTAGWLLLDLSIVGPLGGDGTVLLPAFAGLFGTPLLLLALVDRSAAAEVTDGGDACPVPARLAPWIGTGCGLLVALFPGLTSATAGVVGRTVRAPANDSDEVAMLSAVDTANVVGNTAALVVWGATRSGASAAAEVAEPGLHGAAAGLLAALVLTTMLIATVCASVLALRFGPGLVRWLRRIPPKRLAGWGLGLLVLIVVLHSGPAGLLLTLLLVPLGLLPHRWGVPRALLMGFLLVPYLVSAGSG